MPEKINLTKELLRRFEAADLLDPQYRDWGVAGLPISGHFCRNFNDPSALVSQLKERLPADVRLFAFDGVVIRHHYLRDQYVILFVSKEWPRVKEGESFPALTAIFLGDNSGAPPYNISTVTPIEGGFLEIRVNKSKHRLTVPKESETESAFLVRIEPIDAE